MAISFKDNIHGGIELGIRGIGNRDNIANIFIQDIFVSEWFFSNTSPTSSFDHDSHSSSNIH